MQMLAEGDGGGGHRGVCVSDLMNVSQVEAEEFFSCFALFSSRTLPGEALRPPTKIDPGPSQHQHCAAQLLAGVNGPSPT